jgi:hypothetical protein
MRINHLSDNILLKIFSFLDDGSLTQAGLVCKRWNYLTKTTELWLFKCLRLGIEENLGRVESILVDEMLVDEDIDWKMAYVELKVFVKQLKLNYIPKLNELSKSIGRYLKTGAENRKI